MDVVRIYNNWLSVNMFQYYRLPTSQKESECVLWRIRLSVKAGMGNRGMEWGEWWECRETGWECEESGWECGESGWECRESGWKCRYINTWQVFYKTFSRQDIPHYILKIKETLVSRNTSQQLLPRVVISSFLSTFNKVSKTFYLSNFNNITQKVFSDQIMSKIQFLPHIHKKDLFFLPLQQKWHSIPPTLQDFIVQEIHSSLLRINRCGILLNHRIATL